MSLTEYHFYNRPDYIRELISKAKTAKVDSRIAIIAMYFDHREPLIVELMAALEKACKAGAEVLLVVDAFSFMLEPHPWSLGPLLYGNTVDSTSREPYGGRYKILDSFRESGGKYAIINKPSRKFTVPHSGRSHIKAAVIDDTLFIGGHNLGAIDEIDVMTSFNNTISADTVFDIIRRLVISGSTKVVFSHSDLRIKINSEDTLFIDSGMPHKSIIFNEAFKLIDNADKWIFVTCQYYPGVQMARHLKAAYNRGVRVELIYNPPSTHGKELLGHIAYNFVSRARYPSSTFAHQLRRGHPKLHAKLIATDKGALIGSHNFVPQGVFLGTAEIALLRLNSEFSKCAIDSIKNELSKEHNPLS